MHKEAGVRFFKVFINISQRSRVKYSFNFNQYCFKLFVSDSSISEGFLEAAFYGTHHSFQETAPPRGAGNIEPPGNTMLTEKSLQT